MSDFTQARFYSESQLDILMIQQSMADVWDAFGINQTEESGWWVLTISELDLKESLILLDKLKNDFGLTFVITYGVY